MHPVFLQQTSDQSLNSQLRLRFSTMSHRPSCPLRTNVRPNAVNSLRLLSGVGAPQGETGGWPGLSGKDLLGRIRFTKP